MCGHFYNLTIEPYHHPRLCLDESYIDIYSRSKAEPAMLDLCATNSQV